jgi:hypothetical protein
MFANIVVAAVATGTVPLAPNVSIRPISSPLFNDADRNTADIVKLLFPATTKLEPNGVTADPPSVILINW